MNPLPLLIAMVGTQAGSIHMELVPSGTFKMIGGYAPIGVALSDTKPTDLVKTPDLVSAKYGSISFGGRRFTVAVDKEHLYVDSNANGDLTDDPATDWHEKTYKSDGIEKKEWEGFATVNVPCAGKDVPCRIGIYETSDTGKMGCYVDFGLVGTVTLAGQTFPAIISDTSGSFDAAPSTTRNSILMIDLDHNGSYNPGYEFFPIEQPFNIHGTTYEVKGMYPNLTIAKSAVSVPERTKASLKPIDPNAANGLRPGSNALKFTATDLNKKPISFPGSYAGKLVLIDFWATWCGPCMHEAPNLVKTYQSLHHKGLEVLGICLDDPGALATVKKVTGTVGMTWDQIYDTKAWQGTVVKQYQIKAIPATYLVDGDTGKILAISDSLRGPNLQTTVEQELAKKGQSAK